MTTTLDINVCCPNYKHPRIIHNIPEVSTCSLLATYSGSAVKRAGGCAQMLQADVTDSDVDRIALNFHVDRLT